MIKKIIFILILCLFSLSLFAAPPLSGEEYIKQLKKLKPSKNIASLLNDTKNGLGYVEVRGTVQNIFDFGEQKYCTLQLNNSNIDFIYVNIPEDIDNDDLLNKNIACVLKWDILSLNQNVVQTIQLNKDEQYDIEFFAYLEPVTAYESELSSKVHQYGKPSSFIMPQELTTPEEKTETPQKTYYISSSGKSKIFNIIKTVNNKISDPIATAYAEYILAYSGGYGVDPLFTCAIITAESRFKSTATSRAGAQGLGQLMPGTARGLGLNNAYDPQQGIYGTAKYLKNVSFQLFKKYPAQLTLSQLKMVIAAYNAGPRAVKKYGGIPPYNETKNYVSAVLKNYSKFLNMQ